MARIRAVLFDIDGTLLDSNDAQAHAWLDSLHGHGHSIPFERLRSKIGMTHERLLGSLLGIEHVSVEGQSIIERYAAILKGHYLGDVGPFHGARMLVDRLRSRGLCCAALAGTTRDLGLDLLRAAGVGDLMDLVLSLEDIDEGGTRSDLVHAALERIGIAPQEALLIGDTPFDVELGRTAGVGVVALRCGGGFSDGELSGAIALYDDPAELSARLDNSPLALDRESDPPPAPMKVGARRLAL